MAESTAKAEASHNGGICAAPIFDFDLEHIIPCMLHMLMAVVRKHPTEMGRDLQKLRDKAVL